MKRALLVFSLLPALSLSAPGSLHVRSFTVPGWLCDRYPTNSFDQCHQIDYSQYNEIGIVSVTTRKGYFVGHATPTLEPFNLIADKNPLNEAISNLLRSMKAHDPDIYVGARKTIYDIPPIRWDKEFEPLH
jgi:hypothetical protein